MSSDILFLKTWWNHSIFPCVLGLYGRDWTICIFFIRQNRFTDPLNSFPLSDWRVSGRFYFFIFSFTPRECFLFKRPMKSRKTTSDNDRISDRLFLDIVRLGFLYLKGLFDWFHEPKFRKKNAYKRVQKVFMVHPPSQACSHFPWRRVSRFYFFVFVSSLFFLPTNYKNAFKKVIQKDILREFIFTIR